MSKIFECPNCQERHELYPARRRWQTRVFRILWRIVDCRNCGCRFWRLRGFNKAKRVRV